MVTINTISDIKFSFNGVNYLKNFTPIVVGDKIRILNTYDSKIELTDAPTLFSDFTLDGLTYANVALLQDALLLVIFTRSTLSGGGGGATTFLDLTDTPSAYTGQANKIVRVNAGETGLDFTDEAGSAIDLTQFPNTYEYGVSSAGFVQLGAYSALTIAGTQSNANANTDSSIRLRKILSSAIAGNSATAYQGSHTFISANQGFYFDTRVDEIDSGTVSDSRCFYGLAGTSLIGNIEPGSYSLGMLGLGHESTDTYFNILYKGIGLTAIDKISLGAGFPKNSNHKYAIRFWRFPNTTLIYYSIRNLSLSNLFVTGSFDFTADVPALTPNFFRNNNTTAIAVGYGINRILTQTSDEYV